MNVETGAVMSEAKIAVMTVNNFEAMKQTLENTKKINRMIGKYLGIKNSLNYCNDLNAMRIAEMHLSPNLKEQYTVNLAEETRSEWSSDFNFFCASSMQRANAFLKTIGLI